MAFTSQTVSSIADMFSKLDTFLAANGWSTHRDAGAGEFAAWKNPSGSIWITSAFQWDTGTPSHIGVYQWHGQAYDTAGTTGTVPYDQDDDSGNGAASTSNATLFGNRKITVTNSPESMWVFEDTNYWHAVVRYNTDIYIHFGSGYLNKYNDWTGGEYTYGQVINNSSSSNTAVSADSSFLLDGLSADGSAYSNMEERVATLHIEGMAEQGAGEIWGVCMGNQSSSNLGTDRAGGDRIHILGGFRAGPHVTGWGQYAGTVARGLVPLYPIVQYYWDRTANQVYGPLGSMPDVRGISIRNFSAEQEITIGGDTWVVFPARRRSEAGNQIAYTNYQGIAYKQVA